MSESYGSFKSNKLAQNTVLVLVQYWCVLVNHHSYTLREFLKTNSPDGFLQTLRSTNPKLSDSFNKKTSVLNVSQTLKEQFCISGHCSSNKSAFLYLISRFPIFYFIVPQTTTCFIFHCWYFNQVNLRHYFLYKLKLLVLSDTDSPFFYKSRIYDQTNNNLI